jgi:hypothetical protein
MRRKTIPPQATPRSAEVISLATWTKPKDESGLVSVPTPQGADLARDNFYIVEANSSYPSIGARSGDYLITLKTEDVREGDFAVIDYEGREGAQAGLIHFSEVWLEVDGDLFHRAKSIIRGRVVEVQRAGERIPLKITLRPIRQLATIYQFKRRGAR